MLLFISESIMNKLALFIVSSFNFHLRRSLIKRVYFIVHVINFFV